jgi:hypothetical protein
VKGKKRELVQEDVHLRVKGKRSERIEGTQSLTLLVDQLEVIEGSAALTAGKEIHFASMDKLIGEASDVTFKGPGGFIRIDASGVTINGTMVEINVGGTSGKGRGSKPELPELPDEAKVPMPAQPGRKAEQNFLSDVGQDGVNKDGDEQRMKKDAPSLEAVPLSRIYKKAPTAEELSSDPLVDHELKKAWADSRPNAPEVPRGTPGSVKQEQGGWLVWAKNSGRVSVTRVPGGTRDGLGTIAGTRPADSENQQVVGWFHTHPNTAAEGYRSGPSPADVSWQNAYGKAPGLIETHEGRMLIPFP